MAEIKGIDVSANQGNINWKAVANYGMGFAILRITEKGNVIDPTFERNYKGCVDNKIPVGVYKYSYATSIEQIKTEANIVIKTLNKRKLDYPVFLDIEDKCQRNISKSVMMQMINAFRAIIVKAGYKFGIYCGYSWYQNKLPDGAKKYDCWVARYSSNDDGFLPERLRIPASTGIVGWQYSSKSTINGIPTKVDRSVFYKDYSKTSTNTSNNNSNKTPQGGDNMSNNIVQNVINDAVSFAIGIANDNSHGYSQAVRSLYNITVPKSFDCSSLCCTSYYYAFLKNGLTEQANYLKSHCSYTENMLNMLNVGFEIVARNQTAHAQMQKGDLELNVTHHVAMAIDKDNIVHARSSEGTTNTIDDSGNEIRTQPWYNYSHGWTHRLRFTGKGLNLNSSTNTSTTVTKNWIEYGDRGNNVKTLQTKLNKVGYKLEINGICGNATVTAIKDFQTKYDLAVDGQAGKNTITKLDSVISAKENKNFKAFVGACTTDGTSVYQKATGATALATYPMLNRGNLVDVIGVSGSRYKIKIANAYTGYIDKAKITTPDKLTKSEYPYVGKCTGNDVAVRKDAGTSYAKISGYPTLNKDNKVDVLGVKKDSSGNEWKQVKIANKYVGYVFGKYITRV
jgi:GH25 family lysozyme M1 (1,4-beta-N-acetylmuramidase)